MIKEVYLIFKTHLDIGFTDYADTVIHKYLNEYLPAAIETAREQEHTPYKFIWTTGSWLIAQALKRGNRELEQAIRDGLIQWHALPFTTHTEYMNEELFSYGLDISQKLDAHFGKKTIAAKMTDVPGHTVGIVPLLAARGIELLHIGVNPASPVPEVPNIFRWKWKDDSIIVIYSKEYGEICEIGDIAIAFGFTGDNHGPQGGAQLEAVYENLQEKYPNATIRAATLNDVALALRGVDLPVIEAEIGDNWIHGVGTDPSKTRGFRALLRCGKPLCQYDLDDSLLLVPEHTWGMDLKTFFPNQCDWTWQEIEACETKETIEKSWKEQYAYVERAAQIMGEDLSEHLTVSLPDTHGMLPCSDPPSVEISYQLFDRNDYEQYRQRYLRLDVPWSQWDMLKPGLPEYEGGMDTATVSEAWQDSNKKVYKLTFSKEIRDFAGLPDIYLIEQDDQVEVRWFGKKCNRLPEAFWMKFNNIHGNVLLKKLGQWVDPASCVGMKNLHAVWAVRTDEVEIEPLDTPLAAPYGRNLLQWNNPCETQELYFNLYNNVWNTNFPMWFSDHAKFRFKIKRSPLPLE